jgi:hypothetical protein
VDFPVFQKLIEVVVQERGPGARNDILGALQQVLSNGEVL